MQLLTRISTFALLFVAACCDAAPLFEDDAIIEVELRGPIGELIEHKQDREERPFEIVVDGQAHPVMVRARGNSRLKVCNFPPLRLNFSSSMMPGSLFDGQNRLKLVTHCNTKKADAGNVLDEYLAYKIFNLLSDYSFRVRLIRIRYVDTQSEKRITDDQYWAFLIEPGKLLSKRTNAPPMDIDGVYLSRINTEQAGLVFVFNYLIGNTDWSLVKGTTKNNCCHNIELLDADGQVTPVPYDFDHSGLVDASYVKPNPSLRLRSVRSRAYRGYCIAPESVREAVLAINDQRAEILELANEVPALSDNDQYIRLKYLEEFFDEAQDSDKLLREFERSCL